MLNKLFLMVYNSYVFYQTYGLALLTTSGQEEHKPIKVLDDWILARLEETIIFTTKHLDHYEIGEAGRLIEHFVDDLSRWYIRRSRKNVSGKTLHKVLIELTKLLAPFTPFFSEALYQSLITEKDKIGGSKKSVHLEDWPSLKSKKEKVRSKKLLEAMSELRRLASLVLAEREKALLKVRQPLRALKIKNKELSKNRELLALLAQEVNVKKVILDSKIKGEIVLDTVITPELRNEGIIRELTRLVQGLRRDAGYKSGELILLNLEVPSALMRIIEANLSQFKEGVNVRNVDFSTFGEKIRHGVFDAELNTKLEEWPVWMAVRK